MRARIFSLRGQSPIPLIGLPTTEIYKLTKYGKNTANYAIRIFSGRAHSSKWLSWDANRTLFNSLGEAEFDPQQTIAADCVKSRRVAGCRTQDLRAVVSNGKGFS